MHVQFMTHAAVMWHTQAPWGVSPGVTSKEVALNRIVKASAAAALAVGLTAATASASSLKGSPSSMRYQHEVAVEQDYTFLRTAAAVREFAAAGRLDTVAGNADYRVNKVSFPYARAEVVSFIERLAREYRAETGELLVVTSLTRPTGQQPGNAHKLSVHPAGMAVDLRVPFKPSQRSWLEARLLAFEEAGVLDVTRERHPPHYHVAVFPGAYRKWAAANPPRLDETAVASAIAHLREIANGPAAGVIPLAGADAANIADGFNGWAFFALAGAVLVGGALAQRLAPATVRSESTSRQD